jgi:hypothetical protein
MFTKARHWTLSWASRIQFATSIPISLRSILMLSSYLRQLSLAFGPPNQNPVNTSPLPHAYFTLALHGGEWSVLRPGRFTPRERAPVSYWIGGWMGLRTGLDAVVRRRISSPYRDSNPRSSSL